MMLLTYFCLIVYNLKWQYHEIFKGFYKKDFPLFDRYKAETDFVRATKHPSPLFNPQPSTLNPQSSALNPQSSTRNPQPSTLNPQPSTLNRQPSTLNPESWILNPQSSILPDQLPTNLVKTITENGLATYNAAGTTPSRQIGPLYSRI